MHTKKKLDMRLIAMGAICMLVGPFCYLILWNEVTTRASLDVVSGVLGGLALWMAFIGFVNILHYDGKSLVKRFTAWQSFMSVMGIFAGIILFMGGFSLCTYIVPPPHESWSYLIMKQIVFWGTLLAIVHYAYCFFFLWRVSYVGEATLVIANGRVYFPGDAVTLYPWFKNNVSILEERLAFNEDKVTVTCKDGMYTVGVSASLAFDFTTMRTNNVGAFDTYAFVKKAHEWLIVVVRYRAHDRTLGELLTKPHDAASTTIDNIPVTWDGKGVFSFAQ